LRTVFSTQYLIVPGAILPRLLHEIPGTPAEKGGTYMITQAQQMALTECFEAARTAGHIWPAYAACEAMEESAWGTSELYSEANNPFGQKAGGAEMPSIALPTWEVVRGVRRYIIARFVMFGSLEEAFDERMNLLRRLAPQWPHYAAALSSTTGEEYVREVSATWSTDPLRADNVLAIYREHGLQIEAS
jgi:flagellum-specific peptidoglycan hydrolase FlgJ